MILKLPNWMVPGLISTIILSACNLGATPIPTQDPGVIQTQAFNDVSTQAALQQTQTALAAPAIPLATNTPLPTATLGVLPTFAPIGGITTVTPFSFNTQQPGFTPITSPIPTLGIVSTLTTKNGCNDGAYVGETAPYDKDVLKPGKAFTKAFTILNTGTCAWDEGYRFEYLIDNSSPELKGETIVLPKNRPEDYTKPGHSQSFVLHMKAPNKVGEFKAYWKLRDDVGNYFGPLVYVWIIVK